MKQLMTRTLLVIAITIWGITGNILADTIHVPADYPTIQAGIDAAIDGDTVLVADGTYSGDGNYNISMHGKDLVLKSEHGYESCIIDCLHLGSGVYIGGPTTVIDGFTIIHSKTELEIAAVKAWSGGTVSNCLITNNYNGVYSSGTAGGVLNNCIIRDNTGCGIYTDEAGVVCVDCIIKDNNEYAFYNYFDGYTGFFNCYIQGSGFVHYWGAVSCYNCTIQGVIGGYVDSLIQLHNCILWPGGLYGDQYTIFDIKYSDIQGGFTGEGNINLPPKFVNGPLGTFYLSSKAAGQAEDSPCIDAGSGFAENICDTWQDEPLCMNTLCTRTDSITDDGIVDMGLHYSAEIPSTPTPFPSNTPEPTETPTPEPTNTPYFEGVDLVLNNTYFQAGDWFKLRALCSGPDDQEVDLYVILDVMGAYWFYPDWTRTPCCETFTLLQDQMNYRFIFDFIWPEGNFGQADGLRFWGAMCYAGTADILGEYDCVTFGYR